jgi:hypothetical protein
VLGGYCGLGSWTECLVRGCEKLNNNNNNNNNKYNNRTRNKGIAKKQPYWALHIYYEKC